MAGGSSLFVYSPDERFKCQVSLNCSPSRQRIKAALLKVPQWNQQPGAEDAISLAFSGRADHNAWIEADVGPGASGSRCEARRHEVTR